MKRTALRSVGRKRRSKQALRAALVERVLARDNYRCQFFQRAMPGDHPAARLVISHAGPLDVHEIIPRSAWPGGELVDSNCLTVCRSCHQWIDDHPTLAHQIGLHGYSHERPDR